MNQQEFFQANAVDGVLKPELMGQMLSLPEGESGEPTPQSSAPAAAPAAPAPAPVAAAPAVDPDLNADGTPKVILAKDGVHTIDYQRLVDARDGEKEAKARADAAEAKAEELRLELAAAKAAPAGPSPAPSPEVKKSPLEGVDFGDFSDESLKKGILEAVERGVAAALPAKVAEAMAPLQKQQQTDALTKHFTTIARAHPNYEAVLESQELKGWIESQPSFAQAAINAVLDRGTAEQVVEVFDSFKKATEKPAAPAPAPAAPAVDPAKAAQAVIDAAKSKPPTSLSEIPGSTAVGDEAAAMLESTPMALMRKFAGKSPDEINAAIARAL